jgi:hypothetical protein
MKNIKLSPSKFGLADDSSCITQSPRRDCEKEIQARAANPRHLGNSDEFYS